MKLKKTTAYLLAMILLFPFASAYLLSTATAHPITITWLTHWTEPSETAYWDAVVKAYEASTGYTVDIDKQTVEFALLYETVMLRHAGDNDPDLIHLHGMWVPSWANWRTEILAIPPSDVQEDIRANWTAATVSASTYRGIAYGYPTEFNSWALVYNKKLFQDEIAERTAAEETENAEFLTNVLAKLEADIPLNWTVTRWGDTRLSEFTKAAELLTEWDTSVSPYLINHTGFVPFVEGMPEEQRFQFMSLLWSNGGGYLDLSVPTTLFNSQNGQEVMQLYQDLGYVIDTNATAEGVQSVYDPANLPDYWWTAWADETVGMMILPTWMTYLRDAMGENFDHLGVAPIPMGPHGTKSESLVYSWLHAVTKRAERPDVGTAGAAWDFLRWLNAPKDAESIDTGVASIGKIPKGNDCSIMGDFLIYDSIVPSRKGDIDNGKITEKGKAGPLIKDDFWFSNFTKFGSPPYGRSDKPFTKSEEVQTEIGLMFERVVTPPGEDAVTSVITTASYINQILPMAGDLNFDGPVDILDADILVNDILTTVSDPQWLVSRGRSDITEDGIVEFDDAYIIYLNFGRSGDP